MKNQKKINKYLLVILVIILIFTATNTIINITRTINSVIQFRHDSMPDDFMENIFKK